MSDSTGGLRRKIESATDLQSVVRTMKTLAASNIGPYEKAMHALADCDRTVTLGLAACFREGPSAPLAAEEQSRAGQQQRGAIVFGSDQGLVGRFNEVVADFAIEALAALPGRARVWAVGERVHARLTDAGLAPVGRFDVPNSVDAIAALVGRIQLASEGDRARGGYTQVHVFHNRPKAGALYEPVGQRMLPLDASWQRSLAALRWPTGNLPEVLGKGSETLVALIREYLFISLFRACAESLASENASRLAAMQRADKNIDELLQGLRSSFHRLRQSSIDEELFDVTAGYESLAAPTTQAGPAGVTGML